jgi:alanine racemase
VGIATHLANVEDVTNTDFAHLQMNRLLQAIHYLKAEGFTSLLTHCASSASALLIKEPKFDLNRIGISLYGLWPSEKTRLSYFASPNQFDAFLRPVLSWKTRISSIREIEEGDFVSYGCTFKALHKMKVGVIPVGYYEGYPRLAAGRGAYVIVRGRRCMIIGRICMNMAMIDLDNSPQANVGDVVTLIGRDASEEVSAEQLAQWAETIHYEVVARLNSEIPKIMKP